MEREALHSAAVKFALDLHPSATEDVMQGVRDQLNASLLRSVTPLVSCKESLTSSVLICFILNGQQRPASINAVAGQALTWMVS